MTDTPNQTAGIGIVERAGWEKDKNGGNRFTALVVFANGPPSLPLSVVWERTPVRIVVAGASNG